MLGKFEFHNDQRNNNFCIFSELLILSENMKSEMLKQTTCDYIANNLGNVMETTVSEEFIIIFLINFLFLGLDRS
jgi:hypothetical protein